MALTLLISAFLLILAAVKKRYIIVLLAFVSMSVAVLFLVRNAHHFAQFAMLANVASNVALIAFIVVTVIVLCKKE